MSITVSNVATGSRYSFYPATPERWSDIAALFGERGACGGCWCMWWRQSGPEYKANRGTPNRDAFRAVVEGGETPGVLAYADGRPVGWCALAPREKYARLRDERIRIFKRVDEQPVWSVTCFYIDRSHRGQGLMLALLSAAVGHAQTQGAKIVEGYPLDTGGEVSDTDAYCGLISAFTRAGFVEVLRRSEKRPIMRLYLGAVEVGDDAGSSERLSGT